jgi:hypothetical protein
VPPDAAASLLTATLSQPYAILRPLLTPRQVPYCGYAHVGCEVIVDEVGNLIMEPSDVEKSFRSSFRKVRYHEMSRYLLCGTYDSRPLTLQHKRS